MRRRDHKAGCLGGVALVSIYGKMKEALQVVNIDVAIQVLNYKGIQGLLHRQSVSGLSNIYCLAL